ncbi:probable ATP-dependent RNA helicase DDX47 [Pollicipes pollicipes]|uniref:probable ATP-dependent RNA helicase DDX47 n=1 Tax=Pollicipes pollicipes TaxID=41117 RepID=UPI001885669D|nr:probable ATP-dependent RNA helicase DDX47 [Pollicipes pollicipes]
MSPGKDVVGLAETGSGKTGAFALPILQRLLEAPQRLFALVLTPPGSWRASIGVKCCVIVGGMDMMAQSLMLAKKPHVVIATPGRLVMDEADRILNMDFGVEVDKIVKAIPRERQTFLFSATMTKKVCSYLVKKLQRAALRDAVKVEVSSKYQTVDKLQQYYLFIPAKYKDVYLVHILNELAGNSFMVFCGTCNNTLRLSLLLNALGLPAIPLHGQMTMNNGWARSQVQIEEQASYWLRMWRAGAGHRARGRGGHFDIPTHSKDYIHRCGRTARAGRAGRSVTFVTQYDVELYQRIEHLIGKKLPQYAAAEDEVMMLQERVMEADRLAKQELRSLGDKETGRKRKRRRLDSCSQP